MGTVLSTYLAWLLGGVSPNLYTHAMHDIFSFFGGPLLGQVKHPGPSLLKQTASNCNLCIEKKYSSGASKKLALGQPDTPVWDPGIRFVLKDVEKIRFQGYTLPKTNMTNETSTI